MENGELMQKLISCGFKHISDKTVFKNYQMEYLVKNSFILFFNDYTFNFLPQDFLMSYGEMKMGDRSVVSFRWTNDFEEIISVYESVTGKKFYDENNPNKAA